MNFESITANGCKMYTKPESSPDHMVVGNAVSSNKRLPDIDHAMERALEYHQSGQLQQAEKIYSAILDHHPNHPESLHLLGVVCHQLHKNELAEALISRAIQINPHSHAYHNNMGVAMEALGKLTEALSCYQNALTLYPDNADAYNNMGNTLKKTGKMGEAFACYQKAITLRPNNADGYINSGDVLLKMGHLDDAIICYQKALNLNPDIEKVHLNMGGAFHNQGKYEEALTCYKKCLQISPHNVEALNNMGIAFQEQGNLNKALVCHQSALQLNQNSPKSFNCLATAYKNQGKIDAAISSYRQALKIKPDSATIHSNLLLCMHYDANCSGADLQRETRTWWQTHGLANANKFVHKNPPDLHRRLRIGYVSPDFREHSVSYFFLPLLTAHDRGGFEVFCYSETIRPDHLTDRIRNLSNHWRSTAGLTHGGVADQIHKDSIDILVDLAGHSANNRLPVFAQKPAPIQVTWLGYPDTTGIPTIDYRITDKTADPEGEADQTCSEMLIRLPHVFLCYSPPQDAPEIISRKPLPPSQITFASFNNVTKMNNRVIELWSKILYQVPGSRLVLKSKPLADEKIREYYLNLFLQNGVAPDRIQMIGFMPSTHDHLALYNQVDIALDPFPYNGTTTTCEALWMGIPVITLRGDRHASRVGASILRSIRHTELIAGTEEEYASLAISLANKTEQLGGLQTALPRHTKDSPLCAATSFAADMERAYRKMWAKWCAGLQSFNSIN